MDTISTGIIVANVYLLVLAFGMCVLYAALLWFFPYMFEKAYSLKTNFNLRSIAIILAFYTFILWLVFSITDIELGNRILHGAGGGFAAFLACFLAARDTKMDINKTRFVLFSLLVVTSLGVVNELAEYLMSLFIEFDFPKHVNDTWFDLTSNTVGMLIAALVLTPFLGKAQSEEKIKNFNQ